MKERPVNYSLKPMPLWIALPFFGVPAVIGVIGLYVVMPALARAGVSLFWNYMLTVVGMLPLLLGAALVAYRVEGRALSWDDIKLRFRVCGLSQREWLWTVGLLIVYVGGQVLLMPTAGWLASVLPLPLPEGLPHVLDTRVAKTSIPTEFLRVGLRGNWGMALVYLVILSLNIVGEEFWWRGYVLPRQELAHSRWAWLVHGILWTLFHAPFWWNLLSLVPSTLSLSFVTSRLKNTTPGSIVHSAMNGLGYVMILLGILGVGS
jgi:membrane protease YdiL (CAAX protease family)